MNYRFIANQLFALLMILSAALLALEIVFFVAAWWREVGIDTDARLALFGTGVAGLLATLLGRLLTRTKDVSLGRRDALFLVSTSWIIGAGFCALPYLIWAHTDDGIPADHPFLDFVDCYFEAMSGLTTTGATVLSDIEAIPESLLLWRAFTHWLGGLGIVVLFVAVLPSLGVGGRKLYKVEAPGPQPAGITPHIRETARVLWYIYLGLTVVQITALLIAGMRFLDAVCHTFATLATGGFSTENESVGAFAGYAIPIIIIVFMVIAGGNFSLYFQVLRGNWRVLLRDTELRVYLALLAIGSSIIILSLLTSGDPAYLMSGEVIEPSVPVTMREGMFTAVSIQTTTGFTTSDFDRWPFLAKAVLVTLMFIGGSAGSTAGGIKVVRVWVAMKILFAEIERAFRPSVVRPVILGRSSLDAELRLSTIAYVLGFVVLFALGAVSVMLTEQWFGLNVPGLPDETLCDWTTAATASLATICTIGPGLGAVGAVENYGWLSDASKIVLCVLMLFGRLEVLAVLVLFSPRFWRRD